MDIAQVGIFLGAALSVGLSSIGAGVGEGYAAMQAVDSLSRQPSANDKLMRTMLIGQAVTESAAIFSLVVSLLLMFGISAAGGGWQKFCAFVGAGIAVGMGGVGPGFGAGYAGGEACKAVGRMPKLNNNITSNMLIGQALSQTSSIFGLVIAFLLIFLTDTGNNIIECATYLGAGIAMGFGTFGPGFGIGFVVGRTNETYSRFPENGGLLLKTMFLGAAVSESTVIYSLVVALLLLVAKLH